MWLSLVKEKKIAHDFNGKVEINEYFKSFQTIVCFIYKWSYWKAVVAFTTGLIDLAISFYSGSSFCLRFCYNIVLQVCFYASTLSRSFQSVRPGKFRLETQH